MGGMSKRHVYAERAWAFVCGVCIWHVYMGMPVGPGRVLRVWHEHRHEYAHVYGRRVYGHVHLACVCICACLLVACKVQSRLALIGRARRVDTGSAEQEPHRAHVAVCRRKHQRAATSFALRACVPA